jgi:glycosyltransferase involved in cell wall biosynthesis
MAPGGIETLVLDLMRASSGPERVLVMSLKGTTGELIENWPALKPFARDIIGFGAAQSGRQLSLIPKLARKLRQLRPEQVFLHHVGPLLYGGIASRLAGVKRIVHVEHDAWHYESNSNHARILQLTERLLRPAHFAVSQPIEQRLRQLLGAVSEIKVVPPGIDTTRFRPGCAGRARDRLGIARDGLVIGTAGRLSTVKAHNVLLDAMARLDDDIRLVIVGEGEQRGALSGQIAELGLGNRVSLLGHRDDMAEIYPALNVFCLPSLNEGLPRVVLEAQACGIPVVASNVGALRDAVARPHGRLVTPGDAAALASALAGVLGVPAMPDHLHQFVRANFDFSNTMHEFAPANGGRAPASGQSETVSVVC